MNRLPDPAGAPPPLPEAISGPRPIPGIPLQPIGPRPVQARALRPGCYLIRYTPLESPRLLLIHYDGTIRVESDGINTTASGDLYLHDVNVSRFPSLPAEPNPASGIPLFPRGRYRYYLRVTQVLEGFTLADSFTLGFELHRFTAAASSWTSEGTFTAEVTWTTAPGGYTSSSDYLTGEVKNSSGAVVATLTMGWVSSYLRRAVVEIDRLSESEPPVSNGAGIDWRTVFDQVGWDVTVIESDTDVVAPSGDSWSCGELHAAMLARRDISLRDATSTWVYHLLAVRRIDRTPRGIMYDAYATDSNNVPREGLGIASHWTIPDADPWGLVKGMRFGTAGAPYFRTAVHELGHALGLYHNTVDMGVMNTTEVIAASAAAPVRFPNNIQWSFAPDDQKRLRHMPDIWVRPGGSPWGKSYITAPISPDDLRREAHGLTLVVSPLLETIPLGGPVRIDYALVNTTDESQPGPASLRLSTGFVRGKVVDPSGTVRSFSPIVLCLDEQPMTSLEPGQRVEHSATLLRGPQGALFPMSGPYRVIVEIDWETDGIAMGVTGETVVMVTPPENQAHAAAALKILATPDAVVTLAVGGDHLLEGIAAIHAGLEDEVLRPHYAAIEARRVGTRFGQRAADLEAASQLLDERAVLSAAEIGGMARIVQNATSAKDGAKAQMASLLANKALEIGAGEELVAQISEAAAE